MLTSSLRLFQSRLPLHFKEFVSTLCDLAGGSLQCILILKLYSTSLLVKRFHMYGGFKWLIILYIPPLVFANFSCELLEFHLFARVHQGPFLCHYYKLFSLHV